MPDPGSPLSRRITTGRLYFTPTGQTFEEDLGNVVKFKRSDRTETIEHLASTGGVRLVDATYVHTLAFGYLFTLDEYVDRVLMLLQKASGPLPVASAAATSNVAVTFPGITPGATYPVGVKNLTQLALSADGLSKVVGLDYTVDLATGRFTVLNSGTIASGATVLVSYSASPCAFRTVVSGRQPTLQGSAAFYEYDQMSPIVRAEHLFSGSLWINGDSEEQTTGFRTLDLHVQCSSPPIIHERL